jgi:hypothetical protein
VLLVVPGLFAVGQLVTAHQDAASVRELPSADRQLLFRHAVDEVRTVCPRPTAATGALREHCTEQAQFVLKLPECDEQCRRSAVSVLPHARR